MVVAKTGVWFVCMPSFCVKNGSVQSGVPEWKFSRQAHIFIFPLGPLSFIYLFIFGQNLPTSEVI